MKCVGDLHQLIKAGGERDEHSFIGISFNVAKQELDNDADAYHEAIFALLFLRRLKLLYSK